MADTPPFGAGPVGAAGMTRRAAPSREAVGFVALAVAATLLLLLFNPVGFVGGGSDDQRYLAAAREWVAHGPVVGRLHWDLRHPLVLPLAGAIRLLGEGTSGLLAVPMLYALALTALVTALLRARFGYRAAGLWALFYATNPLVHELATRIYPDLAEAFFVILSLAACLVARETTGKWRALLLLGGGMACSLAMLTRETSFFLPLLYAGAFAVGRPLPRRDLLWVALGAVPLLAFETIWLHAATGDWLYRLHVALHHVDVPSNHMAGKVFSGPVLFNPALASRWIVDGPVDIHWSVNPLVYFFLAPFYGPSFWLLVAMGALYRLTPRARDARVTRALLMLAIPAAASFAFVTYVLMISQRPRYYVPALLCATIANALLADRLWREAARRKLVAALIAVHVLVSLVVIGVRQPSNRMSPEAAPRAAERGPAPFPSRPARTAA